MGIPFEKESETILQAESYYSTDTLQSIIQRSKLTLFDCAR